MYLLHISKGLAGKLADSCVHTVGALQNLCVCVCVYVSVYVCAHKCVNVCTVHICVVCVCT